MDALPNANQQSENIGNLDFYRDTSTSFKPTKDDHKPVRDCKSKSPSPR